MADQSVDVTERELREALAESFPERERREHERAARIMAAELRCADDITEACDSSTCEHEVVPHKRGDGVYCAECAAKRVRYSFDPERERAELAAALQRADDAQNAGGASC
jgi:hypothetical protein